MMPGLRLPDHPLLGVAESSDSPDPDMPPICRFCAGLPHWLALVVLSVDGCGAGAAGAPWFCGGAYGVLGVCIFSGPFGPMMGGIMSWARSATTPNNTSIPVSTIEGAGCFGFIFFAFVKKIGPLKQLYIFMYNMSTSYLNDVIINLKCL
jgi:hypothetical protein